MADQNVVDKSMRSVFVGNIPYEATEEKLKEIFSEVGLVVSFKLVFDRDTGKPKGYGFCEYKDQETSLCAMRNLNGYEIGGRTLRVDNACTEKSRMEMQSVLQGPVVESPYGDKVDPEKAPEAISQTVASLPPEQMFELMKEMKTCIRNNPTEARRMLLQNPQFAYALLQAQVVMQIVDPETAIKMLTEANPVPPVLLPLRDSTSPSVIPPATNPGNSRVSPVSPIQQQLPAFATLATAAPFAANCRQPDQSCMLQRGGLQQERLPTDAVNGNILPYATGQDVDLRQTMSSHMQPRAVDQDFRCFGRDPRETCNGMWEGRPDRFGGPRGMPHDFDLHDPRSQSPHVHFQRDLRDQDLRHGHDRPFERMGFQGAMPCGPRMQQPPPVRQAPPPNLGPRGGMLPNVGGAGTSNSEKAALIMQVLQLSDEQVAMLPLEQRQSILVLKGQIAQSAQQQGGHH